MAEESAIEAEMSACVFCRIVAEEERATIVFRNHEFVCFRDIRPAARDHLLVVPVEHIRNVKAIAPGQASIVSKLKDVGLRALVERCGVSEAAVAAGEVSFGFHWPPFNRVDHLHLHVIYPVDEMGFFSRLIFRPNSYWFKTPEEVVEFLKARDGTN